MGLQLAEIVIVRDKVDLQDGMAGIAKDFTSLAVVDGLIIQ